MFFISFGRGFFRVIGESKFRWGLIRKLYPSSLAKFVVETKKFPITPSVAISLLSITSPHPLSSPQSFFSTECHTQSDSSLGLLLQNVKKYSNINVFKLVSALEEVLFDRAIRVINYRAKGEAFIESLDPFSLSDISEGMEATGENSIIPDLFELLRDLPMFVDVLSKVHKISIGKATQLVYQEIRNRMNNILSYFCRTKDPEGAECILRASCEVPFAFGF